MREKYNLIQELEKKSAELKGSKKLSLIGQGDFTGANSVMRGTMNIKHHVQHLAIDNPEFPYIYEGKENIAGKYSSFYNETEKDYVIIDIVKKYDELLKGKCYNALYFLYCKDDDSYTVVERNEVENLTENFGFDYNNTFLDNARVGEDIPKGTVVTASKSYDEYGNVGVGINGRILYAVHPAVQDDAIIVSESFAKRMVSNNVNQITIPISDNTILLNLYGKDGEYQGLPNIGDKVTDGIICATRNVRETRMFSDLRDASLSNINNQSDQIYYGLGEVIDINVYCNNPNITANKVNKQIVEYYNDAKWFYTKVYKVCKKIIKSGSTNIDPEINHWMRKAMNYLDKDAYWAFNDNIFSNIIIEVLIRNKEPINIGRKIVGRAGNKTVVSTIWPDEEMPYLATETYTDEDGLVHAKGPIERVDLLTNPNAVINRTIPMPMFESSITFILDRIRKHLASLDDMEEQKKIIFDILGRFHPKSTKDLEEIYETLSDREKKEFIQDCISLNNDGTLKTNNGLYVRWEAFNDEICLRDVLIDIIYKDYKDIVKPYHIFIPKPKWGRDIYIGKDNIGYQYIMLLKQSGEKGFSVRYAGAISDESLPEKSHDNKIGKDWHSSKPIRFGEYETPNFMIITNPEDFALVTALYRSSVDGRRFMHEAILSDDGEYDIPEEFTSRSSEILQVYLKSLGVGMDTIFDDSNYISEPEHLVETIGYNVGNSTIFCTQDEMYYLNKLREVYHQYMKEHPNTIDDIDEVWDYIIDNLPFKKKDLTENIINLFKDNMEAFSKR